MVPGLERKFFPLKTRITAHGNDFIQDSGRVSQRGHPSLAVRPLSQVRQKLRGPCDYRAQQMTTSGWVLLIHSAMTVVTVPSVCIEAFPLHFL